MILEKSSRRYKGSAHEVSIPCLKTLYDKFPGGHAFGSRLEARPLGTSTPIDES